MNTLKITGPQHKFFRELFSPLGSHVQISGLKKLLKDNKTVQRRVEDSLKEVPEQYIMAFAVVPDGVSPKKHLSDVIGRLNAFYKKRKKTTLVDSELVENYKEYLTHYIGKISKIDLDALRMGLELQSQVEEFVLKSQTELLPKSSKETIPKIPEPKKPLNIERKKQSTGKNIPKKLKIINKTEQYMFVETKNGEIILYSAQASGKLQRKYLPPAPYNAGPTDFGECEVVLK